MGTKLHIHISPRFQCVCAFPLSKQSLCHKRTFQLGKDPPVGFVKQILHNTVLRTVADVFVVIAAIVVILRVGVKHTGKGRNITVTVTVIAPVGATASVVVVVVVVVVVESINILLHLTQDRTNDTVSFQHSLETGIEILQSPPLFHHRRRPVVTRQCIPQHTANLGTDQPSGDDLEPAMGLTQEAALDRRENG